MVKVIIVALMALAVSASADCRQIWVCDQGNNCQYVTVCN